jgi:hypothetical protein
MRGLGLGLYSAVVTLCLWLCVSVAEPVTLAVGGAVALTSGLYCYVRPGAYYKGDLEVCISSHGSTGADPWFGLTTCVYPNIRVTLKKKERLNFHEGFEVVTVDGKRAKIFLDTTLISLILQDVQQHLVEEYYIEEVPFKEALLTNPVKHCIMTEIQQITYEALLKDTNPDATFSGYITKCMDQYSTSYTPTKNTYVKIRKIS